MRIDHFAYQRASRVAGLGIVLQAACCLTLFFFGVWSEDRVLQLTSLYVAGGVVIWLSLLIVFHQHKLERLEALEEDEIAAQRGQTIFESELGATRVVRRRLDLMHTWLMPSVSLVLAAYLALMAWIIHRSLGRVGGADGAAVDFAQALTTDRGWAIAICLSIAAICFVFSRFVAGMAKQPAWQNLRGGAGYMVGTSLLLLAFAVGIVFRFFDNDRVIHVIAFAVPYFMGAISLEIVLNFILNIYRPRVPGETPRPAFDSRVLSLLATPDSIVKSVNEAINYQFGFDITSSWGYKLLTRSLVWLVAFGIVAMLAMSMIIVVQPHQQAIRIRGGEIVLNADGQPYKAGVMLKWPWPLESSLVYDVVRVRELSLTARQSDPTQAILWTSQLKTDKEFEPFIVGASDMSTTDSAESTDDAKSRFSLIDAEIFIDYRIRSNELIDFVTFAADAPMNRLGMTERDVTLRALALRSMTQQLSRKPLDDVLATNRAQIIHDLRQSIQKTFDDRNTGVEIVALHMPIIRPSGDAAARFEDLTIGRQAFEQILVEKENSAKTSLVNLVGSVEVAEQLLVDIEQYEAMRKQYGDEDSEVLKKRLAIVDDLMRSNGLIRRDFLGPAGRRRWEFHMSQRARAESIRGLRDAFQLAPSIVANQIVMDVMQTAMANVQKYVVTVDPERLNVDLEFKETSSQFSIGDILPDEEGSTQ